MEEKQTGRFILISRDTDGCTLLMLEKDCFNDGRKAIGKELHFSFKNFSKGNSGSVYALEYVIKENESISLLAPKKPFPISIWSNTEDKIKWQQTQRAAEDKMALAKAMTSDEVEKYLKPLRENIFANYNRKERIVMIARIIDYIVGGRSL